MIPYTTQAADSAQTSPLAVGRSDWKGAKQSPSSRSLLCRDVFGTTAYLLQPVSLPKYKIDAVCLAPRITSSVNEFHPCGICEEYKEEQAIDTHGFLFFCCLYPVWAAHFRDVKWVGYARGFLKGTLCEANGKQWKTECGVMLSSDRIFDSVLPALRSWDKIRVWSKYMDSQISQCKLGLTAVATLPIAPPPPPPPLSLPHSLPSSLSRTAAL